MLWINSSNVLLCALRTENGSEFSTLPKTVRAVAFANVYDEIAILVDSYAVRLILDARQCAVFVRRCKNTEMRSYELSARRQSGPSTLGIIIRLGGLKREGNIEQAQQAVFFTPLPFFFPSVVFLAGSRGRFWVTSK